MFALRGYNGTALSDILSAAQFPRSSFYYFFDGKEALLDEGYRVLTAADADAAEDILARERVDLLFTDIDLARNTNGIALAHRARRYLPNLPVVYTSGGRGHLSQAEAVTQSVFVPKPYRLSHLVALANEILRPHPHHG